MGRCSATDQPLFAVFDGMGGEECGEVASYLAAQTLAGLERAGDPERELLSYCKMANDEICRYTQEQGLRSVGTTAAILWMQKHKIYLCNIGDSPIFRYADGELEQISVDHVSVAMAGKKPPLLQNLGIPESEMLISPYTAEGYYQKGDIYLICSDGLTDMVDAAEISRILQTDNRADTAETLLQRALDRGGKDNVSFVLLYIEKNKWF